VVGRRIQQLLAMGLDAVGTTPNLGLR